MTQVHIKFAPSHIMIKMYSFEAGGVARAALADRLYTNSEVFEVDETVPDLVAEEVFDLTNNPARQEERERVYGKGRSLSTGDIVAVGDDMFLCKSVGWVKL